MRIPWAPATLAVVDFRESVERYCALVESAESFGRDDFVRSVTPALAELLLAASRLPTVEPDSTGPTASPGDAEWRERVQALHRVLGDWDDYWTTMEPYTRKGKVVCLSAAEDLGCLA